MLNSINASDFALCFAGTFQINSTENRSVLHVALRAPRDAVIYSDGKNVVPDVWNVLDKIKGFSEKVRSCSWVTYYCFLIHQSLDMLFLNSWETGKSWQVGATGKPLKDVIAIGIGGSFLGPLFVHTALQKGYAGALYYWLCNPVGLLLVTYEEGSIADAFGLLLTTHRPWGCWICKRTPTMFVSACLLLQLVFSLCVFFCSFIDNNIGIRHCFPFGGVNEGEGEVLKREQEKR